MIEFFKDEDRANFSGFEKIPDFLLPSFLRSSFYWDSSDMGIATMINDDFETGAPPITMFGDFFRRFGWWGIFFGMSVIGFVLKIWDSFFSKPTLERRLHFISFWFSILTNHLTMDILFLTIISIRPFFITWAMAFVLSRLIVYLAGRKENIVYANIQPI